MPTTTRLAAHAGIAGSLASSVGSRQPTTIPANASSATGTGTTTAYPAHYLVIRLVTAQDGRRGDCNGRLEREGRHTPYPDEELRRALQGAGRG